MKQTLYDILGVPPDASFEEIELAYKKRFDVLKAETSWDSNRLVMLNEAREVLLDPTRRSAYDASLAASSPSRKRVRRARVEAQPRPFAKWFIVGVIVAVILVWWSMRGDAPPGEPVATSTPQGSAPNQQTSNEEPTVAADDVARDTAMLAPQAQESGGDVPPAQPAADIAGAAPEAAPDTVTAEADAAPEPTNVPPQAATDSLIVAAWSCFEPVTGRTSQYTFGSDGQFTVQNAGAAAQTGSYEMTGNDVSVADVDVPQSMRIEELSERKLILYVSGEGRRVVCSR